MIYRLIFKATVYFDTIIEADSEREALDKLQTPGDADLEEMYRDNFEFVRIEEDD